MTFRLVGLISIVLLLCLATFAFMMDHYQEEVMDELAKTVSEVGKATFYSIEGRQDVFVSNDPVARLPELSGPISKKVIGGNRVKSFSVNLTRASETSGIPI